VEGEEMSWTRSLLKYPGGKFTLLDAIDQALPRAQIDLYAEPFLGGASVALNIGRRYPQMALNDANHDLISFWKQIAAHPFAVSDEVSRLIETLKDVDSRGLYTEVRDAFNLRTSPLHEQAAMFYFLNKRGFNGLIRYNSKGQFNVPPGNYKTPPSINLEHLQEVSHILGTNTSLHSLDWSKFLDREVIPQAKEGASVLAYIDPPYIPISKTSNFTGYWKPFDMKEQQRLRRKLDKLTDLGVKFILSNSKCEDTEDVFSGYTFLEVKAPRNISCKGKGRGAVCEYLITNF
jgi:DNA adenine methylase